MGNIHLKLYEIRTSGSGGDVLLKKSLRTEGRRTKNDHNSSPWAFGLGELKQRQSWTPSNKLSESALVLCIWIHIIWYRMVRL